MEKPSVYSSRTILLITIAVAVVLVVVVWPLSQLGKGSADAGGADEAELRILPVARVEMRAAASRVNSRGRT